jgi:EAL domain-containing protein (putative c-di-GMP-specific phosphodiesterase class I)
MRELMGATKRDPARLALEEIQRTVEEIEGAFKRTLQQLRSAGVVI